MGFGSNTFTKAAGAALRSARGAVSRIPTTDLVGGAVAAGLMYGSGSDKTTSALTGLGAVAGAHVANNKDVMGLLRNIGPMARSGWRGI